MLGKYLFFWEGYMNKYLISSVLTIALFVSQNNAFATQDLTKLLGKFANFNIVSTPVKRTVTAGVQILSPTVGQTVSRSIQAKEELQQKNNQIQELILDEQDKDEQIQKLMQQLVKEQKNSQIKDNQIQRLTQEVQFKDNQI